MSDKSWNTSQNTDPRSPYTAPSESVRAFRLFVRLRIALAWCCGGGLSAALLILLLHNVPVLENYVFLPMLLSCGCWIIGLYGFLWVDGGLEEYRRRHFRVDHIHYVAYWSDGVLPRGKSASLRWSLAGSRVQDRKELLRQLSFLTQDTAYIVCNSELHALYKLLYGQDAELISAVLRAVPVLGDSRALPFVRYLAEGQGTAATNTKLRAEAQGSLHRLQTIMDRNNDPRGLLRASSAPPSPEEQLLHPVQGIQEASPGELLRAAVGTTASLSCALLTQERKFSDEVSYRCRWQSGKQTFRRRFPDGRVH
jgi:hypothetical protein